MFSTLIIGTEREMIDGLGRLCAESGELTVLGALHEYPEPHELVRLLNTRGPEVLCLDLSQPNTAARIAARVRESPVGTVVLGFGGDPLVEAPAALDGRLYSPITKQQLLDVVHETVRQAKHQAHDNLTAWIPGKAGSGATMVALSLAGMLAGELDRRVLLIDGDLRSGIAASVAGLRPSRFVQDALARSGDLTRFSLSEYLVSWAGVDILATNRERRKLPDWSNYHRLLQVVHSEYDDVFVDLPEVVNDATAEVVTRAGRVVVVCTPELPSLELAAQRLHELAERGVDGERIHILLNRWGNRGLQEKDIAEALGRPVWAKVPNNYPAVQRVILDSKPLGRETELFRELWPIAREIARMAPETAPRPTVLGKAKQSFAGLWRP